jgi:hypothetical protein
MRDMLIMYDHSRDIQGVFSQVTGKNAVRYRTKRQEISSIVDAILTSTCIGLDLVGPSLNFLLLTTLEVMYPAASCALPQISTSPP